MKGLLAISLSVCAIAMPVWVAAQNVEASEFIYVGVHEDSMLHLVWETNLSHQIVRYVVEKSYDRFNYFAVDSVVPGTLPDIHVENYPATINYYNHILYSTEHGAEGRYIYNNLRDSMEMRVKRFWFRIRMIDVHGETFYTKTVSKTFYKDRDNRFPEPDDSKGNSMLPSQLEGNGAPPPLIPAYRRMPSCPAAVQAEPDPTQYQYKYSITYYAECCYWEERTYRLWQYTQACNGIDSWCCNVDCPPVAYDPCCVHVCANYAQCSCPPWACCDTANATITIVYSIHNDANFNYNFTAGVTVLQNRSEERRVGKE